MNRRDKIISKIDLKGSGLEIGALCWPIVTKSESDIQYVDHVDTKELKRLYRRDRGVVPELMVQVDYPLKGRSLQQTVGNNKSFDYIIASHVMEHVPDMIAWLKDMASVLSIGGVLSLAIPDKRYTFDIDRYPSTPGDVVGAYLESKKRPSASTVFDYASNFREGIDAKKVWEGELYTGSSKARNRYSLDEVMAMCEENKHRYVDTHCFVFTPGSFFQVVRTLIDLGLFDFKVLSYYPTDKGQYEFLVSLEKVGKSVSKAELLDSLPSIKQDPQTRQLVAKIEKLEERLNYTSKELDHLLESRSWKITKPLRYVLENFNNLRHK